MNALSSTENLVGNRIQESIKEEVTVKVEVVECVVCAVRSHDALDVTTARTARGAALHAYLSRWARSATALSGAACRACRDLVDLFEHAEIEYFKIRESFEAVLSKNPLYDISVPQPTGISSIKSELEFGITRANDDSEDEPLARTKRKRTAKGIKKKKKTNSSSKKRKNSYNNKYSWECNECEACGDEGGPIALAAHKITEHTIADVDIKTEDNDLDADTSISFGTRSQSPYNNGMDHSSEAAFDEYDDDDADSTFNPEEFRTEPKKKTSKKGPGNKRIKEWHPCDQCNARYGSLARLEQHKLKHDGSKPPYICEVCGAHYKHKRACDIHIALHKGISDWKCDECNKLFPSKNALQRHNNIHTGKLNYQCDLCGKSFIHTSSFKMHKLSHSGLKPHACDVCGLALMTRSHLKRHKRIHSGEKRHECHICGKRFSERYNLAAHSKAHESPAITAPAAVAPAPPAPRDTIVPRRRLFRCNFCAERFERRYMLERHMSVLHGRTLERPPPTPRNTMSKLLKAQAQARQHAAEHHESDSKDSSLDTRASISAIAPSKLLAQLTSQSPSLIAAAWGGSSAPYAEVTYSQP